MPLGGVPILLARDEPLPPSAGTPGFTDSELPRPDSRDHAAFQDHEVTSIEPIRV